MHLVSCDGCGCVLDKSKLPFAKDVFTESGCVDDNKAAWHEDDLYPYVKCPVCENEVFDTKFSRWK